MSQVKMANNRNEMKCLIDTKCNVGRRNLSFFFFFPLVCSHLNHTDFINFYLFLTSYNYGVNATIILFVSVLFCIVFYFILLYCIVFYCVVLYCIVLYCIVLYCIVLYCIVIDDSVITTSLSTFHHTPNHFFGALSNVTHF